MRGCFLISSYVVVCCLFLFSSRDRNTHDSGSGSGSGGGSSSRSRRSPSPVAGSRRRSPSPVRDREREREREREKDRDRDSRDRRRSRSTDRDHKSGSSKSHESTDGNSSAHAGSAAAAASAASAPTATATSVAPTTAYQASTHTATTFGITQDDGSHVVRVRGMPYQTTTSEILEFFRGLDPLPDVYMCLNSQGRPTGEAYVQFASAAGCQGAIKKDHQNLGRRYVEVYLSNATEREKAKARSQPWQAVSAASRVVRLRGLPFSASENDIRSFLSGVQIGMW